MAEKAGAKKEKAKPKKKKDQEKILYWSIALVVAIIIIIFAATRFYSKEPEYETMAYNNWEFTKMAGMWWFEWQKNDIIYQIPLRFNPQEAKEVPVVGKVNTTKFNSENYVYITFDFSNSTKQNLSMLALAATELTQNIATAINRVPIAACRNNNSDVCFDRPIKNCKNTDEPVILLNEGGGKGMMLLADNCIILQGTGIELVKAVDRLLYHWYRIL